MKRRIKQDLFFSFFIPHYDELSLFIMGYVCLLFMFFNNFFSILKFSEFTGISTDGIKSMMIFFPLIIGMFLCIYHAFTDRRKTNIEKKFMMFFAAITNGFCGIWYGTYILLNSSEFATALFPIWNIINGYILLASLRATDIEELVISDENISMKNLAVGTLIVTIIFVTCNFYFELVWAATFSICVIWATNINAAVNSLTSRHNIQSIQHQLKKM